MPGAPRKNETLHLRAAAILAVCVFGAVDSACAPPLRTCPSEAGCGAETLVAQTRRWIYEPVDMAYARRGAPAGGAPFFGRLGAGDGAVLLLRFAVALPPESRIAEAYVVLERADGTDGASTPIPLRPSRIVQAWNGSSTPWARLPRTESGRGPATLLRPGSGRLVRIDVRDIVERWPLRRPDDFGIAVEADRASPPGAVFVLVPTTGRSDTGETLQYFGPRLELYVK